MSDALPRYRVEWTWIDELPDIAGPYRYGDQAHCSFLIRFADVPPGRGHCAFFCVNIVTAAGAAALGISGEGRRPYIVHDAMTKAEFCRRAADDVDRASAALPMHEALARLNETYVRTDLDFSEAFVRDVPTVEDLTASIEEAFRGVTRDDGVTLHQALAMDDYASPDEEAAARAVDTDTDWHDVPRDVMARSCWFLSYLDVAGFRYYLPAAMLFSLDAEARGGSDTPERTYWKLAPIVAPRDSGKGLNDGFDSEALIAACSFTDAQVRAIYGFACYMAVEVGKGVNEDQLPAMQRWRESAGRRQLIG